MLRGGSLGSKLTLAIRYMYLYFVQLRIAKVKSLSLSVLYSTCVDIMSVSGHKIHGPKGSGFLYVNEKVKIRPILFGGGQQDGMRSGTENVPAIAGLGVAVKEIYTGHSEKRAKLYELKES